ncbi:MAG: D-TA family PLP-dependent enzyme [Verrucomicrobiota bacterium]
MSRIHGLGGVPSPALLFDEQAIIRNLDRMLEIVEGRPELLRPHLKTHKCREILEKQLDRGIGSIKCATLAEARLAADTGVPDVLIAYPLVGPNLQRLRSLIRQYRSTRFSVVVDHPNTVEALIDSEVESCGVYLDLDVGMHRTGILPGTAALELIQSLVGLEPVQFEGIHAYDGHIHEPDLSDRTAEFLSSMGELDAFLSEISQHGLEVPKIVSGGSPTFAFHARRALDSDRDWQCSPGTPLLWDAGYSENFPDLDFGCAALLLARVISHPQENQLCLDLGHKSVSAENPIARRVRFPELGEVTFLSQSEEHLVVSISSENLISAPIGTEVIGIPYHVCPTVALHEKAYLIEQGRIGKRCWKIEARNRDW